MEEQVAPTDRARVRRKAERGVYDRVTVDAILDEAIACHVGFALDGRPWVVPTVHARVGETLYVHGAPANHMLRSLDGGVEACVTVTLIDGLVLSRSAFHHSLNYRSVMLFGFARRVTEPEEKRRALAALVEHTVPGRSADTRPPSEQELRSTLVLALPIREASAKVRTGGPVEDPTDLDRAVWAGELPLRMVPAAAVPDAHCLVDELPGYLRDYRRG
jgi:hypothetical protein